MGYFSCSGKVEIKKVQTSKDIGIYDLIQLSKVGPTYCKNMLVTSLYFCESTNNTFQLPCGMVTPTLFDITTIISLRPIGEIFDSNKIDEDTINFNNDHASFGKYIVDHYDTTTGEVFGEEHIPFLALWLSRCIFCCKSLKVAKRFMTLANQLHDRRNIFLHQLILGSLYETLGLAFETLKYL